MTKRETVTDPRNTFYKNSNTGRIPSLPLVEGGKDSVSGGYTSLLKTMVLN